MSLPRLLLLASLAACADDATLAPETFTPPDTAAEVLDLYAQLDTCNDSFLTRTLTPRPELVAQTLWTTPASDPAGLATWRTTTGWNSLLLASELTLDGVAEQVTSPSAACDAVRRLLTPVRDPVSGREQFTHALLYLDEAAHPYTRFPDGGVEAQQVAAEVQLANYLSVIYAQRETSGGSTTFSDVHEQHLPMYVACTAPLARETTSVVFEADAMTGIDRELCDAGSDIDGDGELEFRCVAERGLHTAGNTCTFVVDAGSLELIDGSDRPALFGGTLTARGDGDALRYSLTVDRFSR